MLVYVRHGNREGIAWPGSQRLADLTGYSLRAVKGHRSKLIDAGVLTVDAEVQGKVKKYNPHTLPPLSSVYVWF